jgi:nucleotide-binding universal stress UspA family protein
MPGSMNRKEKRMYRNILIATDGSDLANKAVEHGVMLARIMETSLIIVTVWEIWSSIELTTEFHREAANPMERMEQIASTSAQKILAAAKTVAQDAGIECETIQVRDRAPAEGIIDTANEKGCDLIVMASHGRRGLNRILLGSQTTEVLAYSKLPVLVLR